MTPRWLPRRVLGLALWLLPAHRRTWAAAMASEFHYLPGRHLAFACGCLGSALMIRMTEISGRGALLLRILAVGLTGLSVTGYGLTAVLIGRAGAQLALDLIAVAPLLVLLFLDWRRARARVVFGAALLGFGVILTGFVLGYPDTWLARNTGSAGLIWALCAGAILGAHHLGRAGGRPAAAG